MLNSCAPAAPKARCSEHGSVGAGLAAGADGGAGGCWRRAAPALLLLAVTPALLWWPQARHGRRGCSSALASSGEAAAAAALRGGRVTPLQLPMANEQPPTLVRPLVLLFGDSLTERSFDPDGGWGAALAHHFARKADVINRGCGGYNSRWALHLLRQVLGQAQHAGQPVTLMTIWFGANDAAIPGRSAGRQHVSVAEYASNLRAMVELARAAGVPRLLLLTPPPVGDDARVAHQQKRMGVTTPVPPDRSLEFVAAYAQAVRDVGGQLGVPVVDTFTGMQDEPNWRAELFDDGLHFTPAGSRRVWKLVRRAIKASFPELSLEAMSNQFPWWDKWDSTSPDAWWAAELPRLEARAAELAPVAKGSVAPQLADGR